MVGRDIRGAWSEQLFDAREDPAELRNLREDRPEDFERLQKIAQDHIEEEPKWVEGTPTLEIDEMELNQLRALGYQVP